MCGREQLVVHDVERLDGIATVDHARDAGESSSAGAESKGDCEDNTLDLGSALGDHVNVDVSLRQRAAPSQASTVSNVRGKLDVATYVNILPAIPTMFFMCLPTNDRMAMSLFTCTWGAGARSAYCLTRERASGKEAPRRRP